MSEHPKVFISYSHQGVDYEKRILEFANRLRSEGIDANVDLYEEAPAEGWPRWMENQINTADFVLVFSSKSYHEKTHSEASKSKGISWEVNIVYQQIYESSSQNTKFVPVHFADEDKEYTLTPLKPFTFYNVSNQDDFDRLYWRLRGVSKVQKPQLGKLRALPEKEQKTMFFTSPIDLDKWNEAQWRGILYLFSSGCAPVLGILYHNYEAGKSIFSEWKNNYGEGFVDGFISVDFIAPPFPKNSSIYSDVDRNYGKGYFVHIGPNIDESLKRAVAAGIPSEELLLAMVSRYQWMDELPSSQNRKIFEQFVSNGSGFLMMPIGIKDTKKAIEQSNLIIDFEQAIRLKKAFFKTGENISDNDPCKVVLTTTDDI